jgi:hypothetical protein
MKHKLATKLQKGGYKMAGNPNPNAHIRRIVQAFNNDDFDVDQQDDIFHFQGKVGIRAAHRSPINPLIGERKRAYYVEGNYYQMGYLMGLMAEEKISRMANDYVDNIVFDYINAKLDENLQKIIGDFLIEIVKLHCEKIRPDIPQGYKDEIKGICHGCKAANSSTKVEEDRLFILNVGADALLSVIYSGKFPKLELKELYKIVKEQLTKRIRLKPILKLRPSKFLRIPVMCHGFSIHGQAAGGNSHFMGRHLMFPNAGVFQDVACMIIYNSDVNDEFPIVCVNAPGMVGSMTVMNNQGVACGVDMIPSGNCNPDRPGMNSIPLMRHCIMHGDSCDSAVDVLVNAQRGVSWLYVIADGKTDNACVVEAGMTTDNLNPLKYPPFYLRLLRRLPSKRFLRRHSNVQQQKGLMVRDSTYKFPGIFISKYNNRLWKFFKWIIRLFKGITIKIHHNAFDEMGYINKTWTEENCPYNYYFAPQRDKRDDVVVASNHFIIPEMRLCSMKPWTVLISQGNIDDIQWRYDELNKRIFEILNNGGTIDFNKAQDLISFLRPDGSFPDYYNPPPRLPIEHVDIRGCISIMDLKKKIMKSQYGYYADEWVQITLPNYI